VWRGRHFAAKTALESVSFSRITRACRAFGNPSESYRAALFSTLITFGGASLVFRLVACTPAPCDDPQALLQAIEHRRFEAAMVTRLLRWHESECRWRVEQNRTATVTGLFY